MARSGAHDPYVVLDAYRGVMPKLLAAAAALALSGTLLLTGCGSDDGPTTADDPSSTPTTSDSTSDSASDSATPEPEPSSAPPSPSESGSPDEPAAPGRRAAETLREFARAGSDLPPVGDQVDLYLGNAFTGFVTRARSDDRRAWATCTEMGDYAGRACPLSPLDVLADHRAVAYVAKPDSTCLQTYGPVPPDLRKLSHVAIVPAPGSVDSCIDDFAVQVFTNADGELVAVSLLMGEP